MRRVRPVRDGQDEPDVDGAGWEPPIEALVAMALAWGVAADVAFGHADE